MPTAAGGTKPQMSNGVWPKADGGDIFRHAYDTVTQVPVNQPLFDAGLGNWYLGEYRHKTRTFSGI